MWQLSWQQLAAKGALAQTEAEHLFNRGALADAAKAFGIAATCRAGACEITPAAFITTRRALLEDAKACQAARALCKALLASDHDTLPIN